MLVKAHSHAFMEYQMAHLEDLVAASRVRETLGITRNGERYMRSRGALPSPIRIGRSNFYLRNEVELTLGISGTSPGELEIGTTE